ncbi:UDP-N-acetylglucosamine 2-epimerase [Bacteroides fragilis]|nr:UDP-N-acetylglucosamine 2-epimerase [Bacteroides fragilis]
MGTNYDKIVDGISTLLDDKVYYEEIGKSVNPYGDGKASERIVNNINYV